jgi:hypothetical protein
MTVARREEDYFELRSGERRDAVHLRCRITLSGKDDEWIVSIDNVDYTVVTPQFWVDPRLVTPDSPPMYKRETTGSIKVRLVERRESDLIVDMPGIPGDAGPRLVVPLSEEVVR